MLLYYTGQNFQSPDYDMCVRFKGDLKMKQKERELF